MRRLEGFFLELFYLFIQHPSNLYKGHLIALPFDLYDLNNVRLGVNLDFAFFYKWCI